jgi:ribose/xylose/arabinose/galactoside ABC-type transport system permease subunit
MQIKKVIQKYFVYFLLFLLIVLGTFMSDRFLTGRNLLNILRQVSVLGFLSIGMSFVILSGHMDLSVGAIMTFTGLIAISFQNFMSPFFAIVCALSIGLALGLLNGSIVTITHANSGDSLMITFGTQMIISGLCLIYTGGFSLEGSESTVFNSLGTGSVFGLVPISVVIILVCVGFIGLAENKFTFGRYMHFIGFNEETSRLAGLPVNMTKIVCYGMSGVMAAFGSIILSARTLGATPTAGIGYEMDAIVAITLGGMSLSGGKGKIINTLIGVVILGIIGNIMNLVGFVAFDQMIVKGLLLIGAVTINTISMKQIR